MSASSPVNPDRLRDSLLALEVCQADPFGGEFKQVNPELIRQLDPFVEQCLEYVSLPSKAAKAFKCYDTDKGRFLGLGARARQQKSHGCLELSAQEQITILFIMALYRTDKEGSSELVADPVEACSGNDHGECDSPNANAPDYIMNRHGSNTENLLEKVQEKISLIKDNLNKYFARDFDYGRVLYVYKNTLLRGNIDYTNDAEFTRLISQMSTKTKGVSDTKGLLAKPKGHPVPAKRRKTISHAANRITAPHLASAEQPEIRGMFSETVNASQVEYAPYQQYSTPAFGQDYSTNIGHPVETAPLGNFPQFPELDPAEQNILTVANQGVPGAIALFYAAPDSQKLFCCLKKLHEMFELLTGQRYLDLLNEQNQGQALLSQAALAYSTLPNTNAHMIPLHEMNMGPDVQYPDGFQQMDFEHGENFPQQTSSG